MSTEDIITDEEIIYDLPMIVSILCEDDITDLAGEEWTLASCDRCDWFGSSKHCGFAGDIDEMDIHCPECDSLGADYGKIALEFGNEIRDFILDSRHI